jgi:hypothetical protein
MKSFTLFLLILFTASAAPKSEVLGQGLVYVRVHTLPNDLPSPDNKADRHPWIIDLRYVKGEREEAALLDSWVKVNASTQTPVFLLANPDTSAAILLPFQGRGLPGLVTIGPKADGFAVDIAVLVKPAVERSAYDAYEKGSSVMTLTTDFPNKPRIDEEKLAKEHIRDTEAPDEPVEDPKNPTPPPPLIDAVLQRAVHLDQGLLALKKL